MGRVPVWGFADVVDANGTALEEGTRVFGYLPMSTYLVVTPARVDDRGFVDTSAHRAVLPPAYNGYIRTSTDPAYRADRQDQQSLLRPLFLTAFLIDDFLADSGFFGAGAVVLSSASSKTAIGTASLLAARGGVDVIGLTSAGNREFVEKLGIYDLVVLYDEVDLLPAEPTVYVDMAGDAAVRRAVHAHLGENLTHSSIVGGTHWDAGADTDSNELPGPAPSFFFAPDRIRQRTKEWGQADLDNRFGVAWHSFIDWTDGWLVIERSGGPEAIATVYLDFLDGHNDPTTGKILTP